MEDNKKEELLSLFQKQNGKVLTKQIIDILGRIPDEHEILSISPCKPGDTVYLPIVHIDNGRLLTEIMEADVVRCYLGKFEIIFLLRIKSEYCQKVKRYLSEFGKTVFLTKEEAEINNNR